mgnify:CR=1 FL=1
MSLGSHIASDCIVRVRNHEGAVGFGTIVGLSRYAVVFEMYHIGTVDRQSVVLPEVLIRRARRRSIPVAPRSRISSTPGMCWSSRPI